MRQIKDFFPRLPIGINLDGLYPNGKIMKLCREYNWDYMIVLKDNKLSQVWNEFYGLNQFESENTLENIWGDRKQKFTWINNIEYDYGKNQQYTEIVHVVVCEETWEEVNKKGNIVKKTRKFAWISATPLNKRNIVRRCNKIARHRWDIEENILIEKHHGYQSEHAFSRDWNAMKGFHYLMRLALLMDVLCNYSIGLYERIQSLGVIGLVNFFKETLLAPVLDRSRIRSFLRKKHYMQLIW